MSDKLYFRNIDTKNFVEEILRDREMELSSQAELEKKLETMSPDDEYRTLYQNLLEETKERIIGYEGLVKELTSDEHLMTENEITEAKAVEMTADDTYWEMLETQSNQELADLAEDVLAIEDSVEDAVLFADKTESKYEEAEEVALQAIQRAEAMFSSEGVKYLTSVQKELQNGFTNRESLTDEEKQLMEEIYKSLSDWRKSPAGSTAIPDLAKTEIAKHPIRYAVISMRQTINEVREAKAYYHQAKMGMLKSKLDVGKAALSQMVQTLGPVKTSMIDFAKSSFQQSGEVLNHAAAFFEELGRSAVNTLLENARKLTKFCDKVLDAATLGAYSKIALTVQKHNRNVLDSYVRKMELRPETIKNELGEKEKTENFEAEYTGKNPLLDSFIYNITKLAVSVSNVVQGSDPETYWKDVTDNAFFWGNSETQEEYLAYTRSPAQAVSDVASNALNGAISYGKEVAKDIQNACENVVEKAFSFEADMAEKMISVYEKKARRLQTKMDQLSKVDHEVFEIGVELKQAMHKLNEITPFVRPEYQPNEQISQAINALKGMNPTMQNLFLIKALERKIEKEQFKFEKDAEKTQKKHDKEIARSQKENDSLQYKLAAAREVRTENYARFLHVKQRADALQEKIERFGGIKKDALEKMDVIFGNKQESGTKEENDNLEKE